MANITYSFCSLIGRRPTNEDAHFIINNLKGDNVKIANIGMFAIFDGHGGSGVSKFLSKELPKLFIPKEIKYPITNKFILEACNNIQYGLSKKKISYSQGSTSLVTIITSDNSDNLALTIFNIGDSRCVLCRNNIGLTLTKDHKPSWPEESARITKLGGKIVSDGYDLRIGSLSVSRAFGDLDSAPYVTHVPEIFRYNIEKKDKFLVVACDGLWDTFSSQDVVNFIIFKCYDKNNNNKRIPGYEGIATELGNFAIKKGATDNISIIVIFFN